MNRVSFIMLVSILLVVAVVAGCSTATSVAPSQAIAPSQAVPSQAVAPSTAPSTTPASPSVAPALSDTFTSTLHGISISYPEGWTTQAATQAATAGDGGFLDPSGDFIYDASRPAHLFLAMRSQPLGSTSADQWAADQATLGECPQTAPITIDGAAGVIGTEGCNLALVTTGGRGYAIRLYTSGDEGWLDSVYDRAWFEKVLATVKFRPGDAVDAAPSPSS